MYRLLVLCAIISICWGFPSFQDERIVGGRQVDITEHPYQAELVSFSVFCGASILNGTLILTAAHCTRGTPKPYYVYAGTNSPGTGLNFQSIDKIYEHPKYDPVTVDYDIAIIKLRTPFKYSDKIKAIRLPNKGFQPPVGQMATVTGFGRTSEGGNKSTTLQRVDVPILDSNVCNSLYAEAGKSITNRMFCAGVVGGGKDSCQGDSGGPLVLNGVQIGVVSWGIGCARPNRPGVYTNIADVLDFIQDTVGEIQNAVY